MSGEEICEVGTPTKHYFAPDDYGGMLKFTTRAATRAVGYNDGDDVAQEAMIGLWKASLNLDTGRFPYGINASFVCKQVDWRANDHWRRVGRRHEAPQNPDDDWCDESNIGPEQALIRDDVDPVLAQAIDDLPDTYRDALLGIAEGTYYETAATAGVPIGTVRSRVHRARRIIMSDLGSNEPDDLDPEIARCLGWR